MSENSNGEGLSLIKILQIFFIPFKPLFDVSKDTREMQIGLYIFSFITYCIPVFLYLVSKNIIIALIPWFFIVYVLWKIGQEFSKTKDPSE